MPHVKASEAPTFTLPGITFTGLAAPSRGSTETSAWRIEIAPGTDGAPHSVDREHIFVALRGSAHADVGGSRQPVAAGDALVVPADTMFSLGNPHDEAFEAVVVLPVGGQARFPGGEPFSPPWTI